MTLLIVRHAHAGNREKWKGDDALRPLSKRGARQARLLAPLLAEYKPRRLLSSRALRCVQTIEPLGELLHLEIEERDELYEGKYRAAIELIGQLGDDVTLISTHGGVSEELVGHQTDVAVAPMPKGCAWVVGDGRPIYIAPPA